MTELSGDVALITGAGSGLGQATAQRFGEAGASVVVADIDDGGGERTVERIRDAGGEALFCNADVSDPEAVETIVDVATDEYGGLDYAVNNAGISGESAPIGKQSIENWQQVIGVDLTGVFHGLRYEIPALLEHGGGAIVNMSSVAGNVASPQLAPYVASKHGVLGLTKNAAVEYSEEDIRVNAVCPGIIGTPLTEGSGDDSEMVAQAKAATPMNRLGKPTEIADAIMWLCSDEASYVTGEAINVDGGYVSI